MFGRGEHIFGNVSYRHSKISLSIYDFWLPFSLTDVSWKSFFFFWIKGMNLIACFYGSNIFDVSVEGKLPVDVDVDVYLVCVFLCWEVDLQGPNA